MPSRNIVADAAIIAPYLTHHITHHGQTTLIPPDNAGRVRKAKSKKPRPKPDRNVRSDDEPRFNVGTPRSRSQPVPARGRKPARGGGRHGRREDREDVNIPDYPPPSFLEAISTPVTVSPAVTLPSTARLADSSCSTQSSPLPRSRPAPPPMQERSRPMPPESLLVNLSDSDSATDISSLEVIELDPSQTQWEEDRVLGLTLEARVKREYRRRVAEVSTPSLSSHDTSQTPPPESLSDCRGRSGRGILDSDSEVEVNVEASTSAAVLTKRKHLAPLRALSLSPSKPVQESTLSARPSASPYSFTRSSSQFFRSTTSLCRLPMTSSAPSSESLVTRKLFASKGKERLRIEPLDSWEMIDSDQPESPMNSPTSPKSPKRFLFPRSTTVPSLQLPYQQDTSLNLRSPSTDSCTPTREQRITRSPTGYTYSQEQKSTSPPVSFLLRQVRRAPPPPPPPRLTAFTPTSSPPASPISISLSNYSSGIVVPSLTVTDPTHSEIRPPNKGKTPPPILPSRDNRRFIRSSTVAYFRGSDTEEPQATPTLKRPLEIRLPTSSDTCHDPAPRSPVTSTVSGADETEQHHIHALHRLLLPSLRAGTAPVQQCTPPSSPETHTHSDSLQSSSQFYFTRNSVHNRVLSPLSNPEPTPARHHYPGRPLPHPPPPRPTPNAGGAGPEVGNNRSCPEGLLIDFEADVSTNYMHTVSSTPPARNQQRDPQVIGQYMKPLTAEPHSRIGPRSHTAEPFSDTTDPFSTPTPQLTQLPVPAAFSQNTVFDLLISQLNNSHERPGFDPRPLGSAFVGPASPAAQRSSATTSPSSPLDSRQATQIHGSETAFNRVSGLVGRIDVERRRVTRDGRVKLKLSLLGVTVDQCGICLSQFRGGEWAALGEACRHAFHEQCLGCWVARSRTCPLCRLPWDNTTNQ